MKNSVTKVIKDNIELINNNDFLNFFSEVYYEDIPEIVDILQTAHIDFLKYMNRIPQLCFKGSKKIQNITIPSNIHLIGFDAFSGSSLTSIDIPSSIHAIDDGAFDNCHQLKSVTIEGAVTIGTGIFSQCTSLETVIFNSSIPYIPPITFQNCISLKDVYFPESLDVIDERSFEGCSNVTIHYAGTIEQWKKIEKHGWKHEWYSKILCTNGTIYPPVY